MNTDRILRQLSTTLLAFTLIGCQTERPQPTAPGQTSSPATPKQPVRLSWKLLGSYPHDPGSFTQGLEILPDGRMLESAGGLGTSRIRITDVATGRVVHEAELPAKEFGEGLTRVGEEMIQLTWRNQVAHRWSIPSNTQELIQLRKDLRYQGEGWGLCYDQDSGYVWRSDGTSTINAHDSETFAVKRQVEITLNGQDLPMVNELECVAGRIWANIWKTPWIVVIDPASGKVVAELNLTSLQDQAIKDNHGKPFGPEQVLNGIARAEDDSTFYVTGKEWPKLYKIRVK